MVQKIRVPLKYLSNLCRTLEMSLINCEINLILTWSNRCFITDNPVAGQKPTFTITDTNLYVPAVTLSTQDNSKLLGQLKTGFKRTINWNKYALNVTAQQQNRCLDLLINPNFQGVKWPFLSFENTDGRLNYTTYYQMKNYNVMITQLAVY